MLVPDALGELLARRELAPGQRVRALFWKLEELGELLQGLVQISVPLWEREELLQGLDLPLVGNGVALVLALSVLSC
jgi:hypothetical protein